MPFLKNTWYAAAWSDEVDGDTLLSRRILDVAIVVARDTAGVPHGLRDRCPHRFAPLHLGRHCGDTIECAYHGLQFDLSGALAVNPHGGNVPTGPSIQSFPIIEKHMLLWIWMGDPALADPARIPDFAGLDPDKYAINKGYMHTPANYEFMTDNIMDLGHIEFLHQGVLGSEAVRHATLRVRQDGNTVHSERLTHDEVLPPALEVLYETGGAPVDRWLDVRWDAPALMQLTVGVAPAGHPERIGKETPGVHLMTPETEDTTHYFWSNSRDFRRDDDELHEQLDQGLRYAFEHQDKPMILAQKDAMEGEDFWALRPIILESDAGAIRARRILGKLIRDEAREDA
jgi:phenylpropionate dioxygenase-like ring-hydroxylating dioxygenase large terminal subunit